jgi:hypothetical protein
LSKSRVSRFRLILESRSRDKIQASRKTFSLISPS